MSSSSQDRPEINPANLVAGRWHRLEGEGIRSTNPSRPDEVIWAGSPVSDHLDEAVHAANSAFSVWAGWSVERRAGVLQRFAEIAESHRDKIVALLRDEVGKVGWDAGGEAGLLPAKVAITLEDGPTTGRARIAGFDVKVSDSRVGRCRFRPHGAMGVLGPFNFPFHLPNGHIAPALLAGNTVVFKPSDKAPACGQYLAWLYQQALDEAGAPPGVMNLVHGQGEIAAGLAGHPGIDGLLFTGSWPVGRRILEANLDRPGRIIALEMGGNNASLVMPDADLRQAAIECLRGAFVTSGQRCTCTRRLILHESIAERFIPPFLRAVSNLIVGDPASDHPVFMGPVISEAARSQVLEFQSHAADSGADVLIQAVPIDVPTGGWFVSPGVLRVERFAEEEDGTPGRDEEVFGPFLRISTVSSYEEGLRQVNATRFGLAASLFSGDVELAEHFGNHARAGCVNVNTATAGASSRLPFGGLGLSGNHRPAGAFSLDYCAYPVAGLIETGSEATLPPGARFEDGWLADDRA